jgi:hypothetical protein
MAEATPNSQNPSICSCDKIKATPDTCKILAAHYAARNRVLVSRLVNKHNAQAPLCTAVVMVMPADYVAFAEAERTWMGICQSTANAATSCIRV